MEDPVKFERDWLPLVEKARKVQADSMVKEYMIPEDKLPSPDRLNVMGVPYEAGTMTDKELQITETPGYKLVAQMSKGELTAKEVLIAFVKRATIAQQLLNCATEFMFDDASARAEELDRYYSETGKTVGAMHGLPISVKEHLHIAGKVSAAGYVSYLAQEPAKEDFLHLSILKKAGAVPFVRTNEPQSLLHIDSDNNIWGMVKNGNNLRLSAGGSSGGEGALVGFHGSPVGLGSDIGGSIRVPAAFNGAYGFRPTGARVSGKGNTVAGAGQITIMCSYGPLTQSIEDIDLYMDTMTAGKPWINDVTLPIMPWKKPEVPSKMKIAVLWDDGIVAPTPPIQRGLKMVVEKLKSAGNEIVDMEAIMAGDLVEAYCASLMADGGKCVVEALAESGEKWHELTKFAMSLGKPISAEEQWNMNHIRDVVRQAWHDKLNADGIDFILCPIFMSVSPPQKQADYLMYSALFNGLDMPSTVFPTGLFVDPAVDGWDGSHEARNDIEKTQHAKYDAEYSVGAPIALQLVGRHFCDEDVIAGTKAIVSLL
ncbi:hypothetical protein CANCADRAFT_32829 [Tortispora caseinolytica NRRL Y-17796]|uniref:amidase n=1 Tax=Tortispora caseinolytica NRRL Y-17796 TaxID=767744 RepID=A0A1E4TCY4_9ASCO|nr:hypothetical protein CANCADRAFT_32829 [Tortispora caseinolytica NRRL Y-17796]